MKKLLLASILMAFGASAQAAVVVGPVICSGDACTATLTCGTSNSTCTTELLDVINAVCVPFLDGPGAARLNADNENAGQPGETSCTWRVTDTSDSDVIDVTIDNSDGLPVELQSLSVE